MRNTEHRHDTLSALRRALVAERDRVLSASSTTLQALAASQIGVEDQSSVLHDQHVTLMRHARDRQTLALIDAALDRFEQGEYGTCVECNGEISSKRLRAVPWALRCVRCQERFESNQPAYDSVAMIA